MNQFEELLTAPKKLIKNHIRVNLITYSENNGVSYFKARGDLITHLSQYNISENQMTGWENNSYQPIKELWHDIAVFFSKKEVDIFFITK